MSVTEKIIDVAQTLSKSTIDQSTLLAGLDGVVQALESCRNNQAIDERKTLGRLALAGHAVRAFFENGGERLTLIDPDEKSVADVLVDVTVAKELALRKIGLLSAPGNVNESDQRAIKQYCGRRDADPDGATLCFGVLDSKMAGEGVLSKADDVGAASVATYGPWVCCGESVDGKDIKMPASPHMCGLISLVDRREGPHRAPAGEDLPLKYADKVVSALTDRTIGERLHEHGVNSLVRRHGRSDVVAWGARTMNAQPLLQYVSVTRMKMMLTSTFRRRLQQVTFRNNDDKLQRMVVRGLEGFLQRLRREGKLVGKTDDEAFRVVNRTSEEDRLNGLLRVQVAVRLMRPAEFIVIELSELVADAAA